MKCVVLLLVAIAYVHGTLGKENVQENLKEIKRHVDSLLKTLSVEQLDSVYVTDLKKKGTIDCKPEFFCQCKTILSGEKLHRADFKNNKSLEPLLRNLDVYNQKRICSVRPTGEEITLHLFLTDLKHCTQKAIQHS